MSGVRRVGVDIAPGKVWWTAMKAPARIIKVEGRDPSDPESGSITIVEPDHGVRTIGGGDFTFYWWSRPPEGVMPTIDSVWTHRTSGQECVVIEIDDGHVHINSFDRASGRDAPIEMSEFLLMWRPSAGDRH